jgi:uncharacterized protein (DUF1697 family)
MPPRRVRYLALLRAVNLPHHGRVEMSSLRSVAESLGYEGVRSVLASGNLSFEGPLASVDSVEARLEAALHSVLGLETTVVVRRSDEWVRVLAHNPYPELARSDPSHLGVVFLKDPPRPGAWEALSSTWRGPEKISPEGQHGFIYYAQGIGSSRLTQAVLDRALGTVGTLRNWNTVVRLAELSGKPFRAGRAPAAPVA